MGRHAGYYPPFSRELTDVVPVEGESIPRKSTMLDTLISDIVKTPSFDCKVEINGLYDVIR